MTCDMQSVMECDDQLEVQIINACSCTSINFIHEGFKFGGVWRLSV